MVRISVGVAPCKHANDRIGEFSTTLIGAEGAKGRKAANRIPHLETIIVTPHFTLRTPHSTTRPVDQYTVASLAAAGTLCSPDDLQIGPDGLHDPVSHRQREHRTRRTRRSPRGRSARLRSQARRQTGHRFRSRCTNPPRESTQCLQTRICNDDLGRLAQRYR